MFNNLYGVNSELTPVEHRQSKLRNLMDQYEHLCGDLNDPTQKLLMNEVATAKTTDVVAAAAGAPPQHPCRAIQVPVAKLRAVQILALMQATPMPRCPSAT